MAKNEILPFAIADGANVLPVDEYQKLLARNNGFSAGVARSQELNRVWRQSGMIAHVIAQFIAETNNSDVLDNGDIEALKTALISALSKNITNTVPAATTKTAGITKLSSATDSDDETLAATPKAVKAVYDLAKKVSVDGIYPVGIVIFFAQNKDPNKLFPGTKWEYTGESKTIRLAKSDGSDILKTGGADTLKLPAAQLPAHGHAFSATTSSFDYGTKTTNTTGDHQHNIWGISVPIGTGENCIGVVRTQDKIRQTESAGSHAHTVAIGAHVHTVSGTTGNTVSGSEINITNAFVTLMCWYRVS